MEVDWEAVEHEAPAASGTSDRERRERLERLQQEVRQARAKLATLTEDSQAAVSSLEATVARGKERLASELDRAAKLEEELAAVRAEVDDLKPRYNAVIARQLGHHLSEGLANMSRSQDDNGPDLAKVLLIIPLIGIGGLLILLMVQGLFR